MCKDYGLAFRFSLEKGVVEVRSVSMGDGCGKTRIVVVAIAITVVIAIIIAIAIAIDANLVADDNIDAGVVTGARRHSILTFTFTCLYNTCTCTSSVLRISIYVQSMQSRMLKRKKGRRRQEFAAVYSIPYLRLT